MFIWVELPDDVDTASLLPVAVEEEHVAYIPGSAFSVHAGTIGTSIADRSDNCMRLNFSNSTPEVIEDGIGRLGRILQKYC